MPLLDITTSKNQLENDRLSTPIRPPPSADARLLRDLKEQVTVLQKDISQQAQRGSGRRMVIKNPNNKYGVGIFSLQFFFVVSTYNGLKKRERVWFYVQQLSLRA